MMVQFTKKILNLCKKKLCNILLNSLLLIPLGPRKQVLRLVNWASHPLFESSERTYEARKISNSLQQAACHVSMCTHGHPQQQGA
jgi:hypothetical protein